MRNRKDLHHERFINPFDLPDEIVQSNQMSLAAEEAQKRTDEHIKKFGLELSRCGRRIRKAQEEVDRVLRSRASKKPWSRRWITKLLFWRSVA